MAAIPAKVHKRFTQNLTKFQKLIKTAQKRDINESDTSLRVTDILDYLLGYDKYSEITTEYAIRGTFCDFALKVKDKQRVIIEVKARY